MPERAIDLAAARILVTNDDGVHAPGLKTLERIAKRLARDVWVVAPESEQSAASHALTLRRPLRVRRLGPRRFGVDGTPTDCVVVAVRRILGERPPDLVLSGINHGGNLGEDVTYSGTVAAALEASLLGLPAVAFSQMRNADGSIQWHTAERYAPLILRALTGEAWPRDVLVNVNFPGVPPEEVSGVRACRQGRRLSGIDVVDGVDPGGHAYVWIGDFASDQGDHPKGDLRAVAENAIAVTPLHPDMTHRATLTGLGRRLNLETLEEGGRP